MALIAVLAGWRAKFQLLRPEGVQALELDVTNLSAAAAADAIYANLQRLPETR